MSKSTQRVARFSGYNLFTQEFFKEHQQRQIDKKKEKGKGKGKKDDGGDEKSYYEVSVEMREGWKKLTSKEKGEYAKRAEQLRAPAKEKKYLLPFLTRCAPNTFMQVCNKLKGRPEVMARLKAVGFDRLVDISYRQINRSLCAQYMKCFDPPTKEVCIRGQTRVIGAEHVHELMGLPFGGTAIKINVDDHHPILKDLRAVYKNVKYKEIGEWLVDKVDENFEFLFVLFALGTLLAPSASICVTDRLLKIMTVTKDSLADFDWSSFIIEELCKEVYEFKRNSLKLKEQQCKTVGGCLYFLMLFCFENFPLGDVIAAQQESAMAFWTDEKVKSRVLIERKSKKGLLVDFNDPDPIVSPATSFNADTMLTHPVVRTTYARLLNNLQKEMLELQRRLSQQGEHEYEAPNINPSASRENDNEDGDDDAVGPSMHFDQADVDARGDDTSIGEGGIAGEQVDDAAGPEEVTEPIQQDAKGSRAKVRRSKRVVTPSSILKSPWIDPKRKDKGKRQYDEKEQLYELCTAQTTKDNAEEEFVDMNGYFLTRKELFCLKPRAWLGDRLMTMVAKTLVADQIDDGGRVTRHIFSADFMQKMIQPQRTWSVEANEAEILPEHIGYNIGDCDFIFGPSIWMDHWFCYVVDTRTMTFYALDSLVDNITYLRLQKQKEEEKKLPTKPKQFKKKSTKGSSFDAKELMANKVRRCFLDILRRVKPQLLEEEERIPKGVTWAKVHLQNDVDSCGVHVVSWLQMWDATETEDGFTMPLYSMDELRDMKVGLLWWLVSHPKNTHRDKVLSMIAESHQRKIRH